MNDDADNFERVTLVLETRWTPRFFAYCSSAADDKVTGQVRVNALDATHSRLLPYLSRHFLLVLKLTRDRASVGEPSTRFSFRDFLKTCQDVGLPAVVKLDSLPPVVEAERRYSRKALRQLRRALSTISPSVAYHLEGIARDLSMTPAELEQLVNDHIKAWEATAEMTDAIIEDIVIELRTRFLEDRKALAELLQLGQITPMHLKENVFDVAQQAEEARQVVAERAQVDLVGVTAAAKKDKGSSLEHIWCRSIIYTPSGTIRVGGRILEKVGSIRLASLRSLAHPLTPANRSRTPSSASTTSRSTRTESPTTFSASPSETRMRRYFSRRPAPRRTSCSRDRSPRRSTTAYRSQVASSSSSREFAHAVCPSTNFG